MKTCIDCNKNKKISEFYKQKDHSDGVMSYCKDCFNQRVCKRWTKRKINAIKYKGDVCKDCKKSYPPSVFEFHHRNPKTKKFMWTKLRLTSWKIILKELDKCDILCANCHRIRHYGANLEGLEPS